MTGQANEREAMRERAQYAQLPDHRGVRNEEAAKLGQDVIALLAAETLRHLAESAALSHCLHDPKAPCAEARDEIEWPDDWCWRCWVKELADAALASVADGTTP